MTLYWPPYRVDLSLNLVLLLLAALYVLLHLALRALTVLADLPSQAKAWRAAQRQQAMHTELRDALAHLLAGRFSRAKKQALLAHQYAKTLEEEVGQKVTCLEVQSQALLVAAEAAQSMRDAVDREKYALAALQVPLPKSAMHFREGVVLRTARWMLDENDPASTLTRLSTLNQGAQRRTLALRLKLRALQMAKQPNAALDTARMLAKHGAFSNAAAASIVRSLAISTLSQAHDADQLTQAWESLSQNDRVQPQVATHAALRLVNFSAGSPEVMELQERARAWIEPAWQLYPQLHETEQTRVVQALEASFSSESGLLDNAWLAKIEMAQRQLPHDARLQYLAGMACLRRQLWGKAQQLLTSSAAHLDDVNLRRSAYQSLGALAEQRGDQATALAAWKQASSA